MTKLIRTLFVTMAMMCPLAATSVAEAAPTASPKISAQRRPETNRKPTLMHVIRPKLAAERATRVRPSHEPRRPPTRAEKVTRHEPRAHVRTRG